MQETICMSSFSLQLRWSQWSEFDWICDLFAHLQDGFVLDRVDEHGLCFHYQPLFLVPETCGREKLGWPAVYKRFQWVHVAYYKFWLLICINYKGSLQYMLRYGVHVFGTSTYVVDKCYCSQAPSVKNLLIVERDHQRLYIYYMTYMICVHYLFTAITNRWYIPAICADIVKTMQNQSIKINKHPTIG